MSDQGVVAIIPARGGSKRLPRKNLAPFFGRPLLQYAIEACQGAKSINRGVYVSTEDPEIAAVARDLGALVIHRPEALAGDTVWTQEVLKHAAEFLKHEGVDFDVMARIHSSPQVEAVKIDEAVEKLAQKQLWEVFSVNQEGVENAVIHVMRRRCVEQAALSVYQGVVTTNYVDVHTKDDLQLLEETRINEIERASLTYLRQLSRQYSHQSLASELRYILGRDRQLWAWQMKIPLWQRWQSMVRNSPELSALLYSRTGYKQAQDMRVLDLGAGFGMYWPILHEFGFKTFVGIDLFDLRRRESYYQAAQALVATMCPQCETQLIMDDARNLGSHRLIVDRFDVVIAVATRSTKLGSTSIPRDVFDGVVRRFGTANCIEVFVDKVT